jgi:hypothetical protein
MDTATGPPRGLLPLGPQAIPAIATLLGLLGPLPWQHARSQRARMLYPASRLQESGMRALRTSSPSRVSLRTPLARTRCLIRSLPPMGFVTCCRVSPYELSMRNFRAVKISSSSKE